jgi:hypothetical protein
MCVVALFSTHARSSITKVTCPFYVLYYYHKLVCIPFFRHIPSMFMQAALQILLFALGAPGENYEI